MFKTNLLNLLGINQEHRNTRRGQREVREGITSPSSLFYYYKNNAKMQK